MRVYSYIILSSFLLSQVAPAQGIFGPSTTDYLVRFEALRALEITLVAITNLDKEVRAEDKRVSELRKDEILMYQREAAEAEDSLKDLAETVTMESAKKIAILKSQIANREGNLKTLQAALEAEESVFTLAKALNKYSLGYLNVVNFASKIDNANKDALAANVIEIKTQIEKLRKELAKEEKAVKSIFTSQEFLVSAEAIRQKLTRASIALKDVENESKIMRKKSVFDRFNDRATIVMKTAECYVRIAKCKDIKKWAQADANKIANCKKINLDASKKAQSVESCKILDGKSNLGSIGDCISDYRLATKKTDPGSTADFASCRI